jgi:hypothetical protein
MAAAKAVMLGRIYVSRRLLLSGQQEELLQKTVRLL